MLFKAPYSRFLRIHESLTALAVQITPPTQELPIESASTPVTILANKMLIVWTANSKQLLCVYILTCLLQLSVSLLNYDLSAQCSCLHGWCVSYFSFTLYVIEMVLLHWTDTTWDSILKSINLFLQAQIFAQDFFLIVSVVLFSTGHYHQQSKAHSLLQDCLSLISPPTTNSR